MGVAPEAMVEFFGVDHRLKYFFDLFSFNSSLMRDVNNHYFFLQLFDRMLTVAHGQRGNFQ
jgi:hypothetical protein